MLTDEGLDVQQWQLNMLLNRRGQYEREVLTKPFTQTFIPPQTLACAPLQRPKRSGAPLQRQQVVGVRPQRQLPGVAFGQQHSRRGHHS